jgi:small subunit ribosomal protein S16
MVKIRLRRVGAKNQPSYRIVVTDSRSPRDGRFIEKIGFYNPRTEPSTVEIVEDRALHWLSVGAQPTEAVELLLKNRGTLDRLARLHAGEELEVLLEEAAAQDEVTVEIDPRTRRDDLIAQKQQSKGAQAELAEAVAEAAEAAAEPTDEE